MQRLKRQSDAIKKDVNDDVKLTLNTFLFWITERRSRREQPPGSIMAWSFPSSVVHEIKQRVWPDSLTYLLRVNLAEVSAASLSSVLRSGAERRRRRRMAEETQLLPLPEADSQSDVNTSTSIMMIFRSVSTK